jgi:hypothetical protein
LNRSQAILEKSGSEGQLNLAATLDLRGMFYSAQQKYTEAEPFFRRSLEVAEKSLGENHPFLAEILTHYADLLRKTARAGDAEVFETRAAALRTGQETR